MTPPLVMAPRELLADMRFIRDHSRESDISKIAQGSIDVAMDYVALESETTLASS